MKLQKSIPLSSIYKREEDFSTDLAGTLDALEVGKFKDPKTESRVGRRQADIVAVEEDGGKLVVENQFGKANWDHWGRLEAYARSVQETTVAALVAEYFEDLMITACIRRNEESEINWYLIQVQANTHKELSFRQVVQPEIDIQAEQKVGVEYSKFWEPIRQDGLFAGEPVPVRDEGWIRKDIRNVGVCLYLNNQRCYIQLYFQSSEHRDKVMALFPESDYSYEYKNSPKEIKVQFPVLGKGKNNRDDWPEIREELVSMGTDIYNRVKSALEEQKS